MIHKDLCGRCGGTGMEPDKKKIGEAMRAMRQGADYSLRDMAHLMGLSAPYLYRMEQGVKLFSVKWQRRYLEITKLRKVK